MKTIRDILKQTFEEGQRYQQHFMQGENPKYIFTGALQVEAISELLLECKPENKPEDDEVRNIDYETKEVLEELYNRGFNEALDDYEKNIKARLQ